MASESVATVTFNIGVTNKASLHLCNAMAILSLATDDTRDVDGDVMTAMFMALEQVGLAKEIIDNPKREEA